MLKERVRERTERKLERSGRITPRLVLEAYEETGCGVTFGTYYDDDNGRACAVGALLTQAGFDLSAYYGGGEVKEFFDRVAEHVGDYYLAGFVAGFDGVDARYVFVSNDESEVFGFRDGARARRFVLARYPDAG